MEIISNIGRVVKMQELCSHLQLTSSSNFIWHLQFQHRSSYNLVFSHSSSPICTGSDTFFLSTGQETGSPG